MEIEDLDLDMTDFGFKELDNVDIDEFFEIKPQTGEEEKKPELITCPHCGQTFEKE